jgi:hypothetical protein
LTLATNVRFCAIPVLRPLAWAGLLIEHRDGSGRLFIKSALWPQVPKFETHAFLQPVTLHYPGIDRLGYQACIQPKCFQ